MFSQKELSLIFSQVNTLSLSPYFFSGNVLVFLFVPMLCVFFSFIDGSYFSLNIIWHDFTGWDSVPFCSNIVLCTMMCGPHTVGGSICGVVPSGLIPCTSTYYYMVCIFINHYVILYTFGKSLVVL
jgi:hypothetical protein